MTVVALATEVGAEEAEAGDEEAVEAHHAAEVLLEEDVVEERAQKVA